MRSWKTAAVLLCSLAGATPALAQNVPVIEPWKLQARTALHLTDCDFITLDVSKDLEQPVRAELVLGGEPVRIELMPHSVRGPNFRLIEQRADGKFYDVKPPKENTLRGFAAGHPGSIVAGGIMPDGLYARIILSDEREYWIEPIAARVPGAPENTYAVYSHDRVEPGHHICGTDEHTHGIHDAGNGNTFSDRGASLFTAQLATDADFEFFSRYGGTGAVNARISLVVNIMNVQYERETDITHVLGTQLVRAAEPDPYGSTDSGNLLDTFRADWNANRPGSRGDIAQLFTGKEVDGNTIGLAFVGVVCTSNAYGIVQSDFNENLMSATDLSAHEAGHNWSAGHCTCSGSGTTVSTMNPFITSINRFTFSNDVNSVGQIVGHRNSRGCLTSGGGGTDPRNDLCTSAVPIGPCLIGWTNFGAGTDGPAACGNFGADIWYTYVAPCDGNITVNTCGSNHDTTLALYSGSCGALTELGCSDDDSACGGSTPRQSQVAISVTRGTTYFIRLGGFNGITGDGLLSLAQSFCPAPSNDNCIGAVTINQGDTAFSTIGASTDGPVETALCNNAGNAQVLNDIWYRYVGQCDGTVRLSTCSADFDSRLAVYTSCPGTFNTAIACNDDNGPSCTGTRSSLDFTAAPGVTYFIRLGGFSGQVGTGTLSLNALSCPPPGNDACASAFTLFGNSGSALNGSVVASTNDGAASCGGATTGPDVWYTYTAPCAGTLSFTMCGTSDINGVDTGMDSVVSIHSGCSGTAANQLTCNDDPFSAVCGSLDAGAIRDSSVTVSLTAGQTVLIRVATFANTVPIRPFKYNYSFTSPTPANDDCAAAQPIGNGTFPFCTVGATNSAEQANCRPFSNDIWYRYTAPCTGTARASLCGSGYDTFLTIYDGGSCAGTSTALVCNDDNGPACGGLSSSGDFPVVAGSSYLIRVSGFSLNSGGGTLTTTCTGIGTTGACCCGSRCTVTAAAACVGANTAFQGVGSACNAPGNNLTPCCKADYNRSNTTTVQDIFDFLSGYFSGNGCADINGSGIPPTVQDIFDFLAAYFAGCP